MEVVQVPVLTDNYVYLAHDGGETAVIDPAVADPVLAAARLRGWTITQILNTHWHPDHVGANLAIKAATGARVTGPAGEAAKIPGLDRAVADGDTVQVGGATGRVIDVPGHTAGHNAYYFAGAQTLFCGDTLFALGCGRLFEGTPAQMAASLARLMALPDDDGGLLRARIYPGERPLRRHRRAGQCGACRPGGRDRPPPCRRPPDRPVDHRPRTRDQPVRPRARRRRVRG